MENNGKSQPLEQTLPGISIPDKVFELLKVPRRYREAEAEVVMWRAVIDRALKDILEGNIYAGQARGWFRGVASVFEQTNNYPAGFGDVCDMACLDPRWVRNWVSDYLTSQGLTL